MRAMVLDTQRPVSESPLVLSERPVPIPQEHEVLIKIESCGVCHTDLHTVEGDIVPPVLPVVPGHQVVGRVASAGDGARRFAEGSRVGVAWLRSACGACRFCTSGRENLCTSIEFNGFHADGGYADYMTAPEAFVYRIPDRFDSLSAAPLLCAGIIGYRSLRLADLPDGGSLGLYGFGASAHIALQVAVHQGYRVYVFSRSPGHRELAERLGAEWTGSAEDDCPEPLSGAITFAPVGWIVHRALEHLDRGGTLAINAIHMTPIPELPYEKIYHERTVRSVANSTRRDAEEFLHVAAEIPIEVHKFVFPLEEANDVLGRLKSGELNGAAVLTP